MFKFIFFLFLPFLLMWIGIFVFDLDLSATAWTILTIAFWAGELFLYVKMDDLQFWFDDLLWSLRHRDRSSSSSKKAESNSASSKPVQAKRESSSSSKKVKTNSGTKKTAQLKSGASSSSTKMETGSGTKKTANRAEPHDDDVEVVTAKTEQKKKFCRHCGAEVPPGEVYCAECGYKA